MSTQPLPAGAAMSAATAETRLLEGQVQETAQLRQRIADLLVEVETLRKASQNQPVIEDLVLQLREANQHLVIATVGAQARLSSAEEANRRQEQFLSMLAHELRNPLAPMAMAAQLLEKLLDSHPQLPRLHGILSRQVQHMTHLVDDLLDASRISSGKITLKLQPLQLSEILESAVETSQPLIERRHQHLYLTLPPEPIRIDGDLVRLAQVFSNLLINAAKFSPEYEVISVSAHRQHNCVLISVQDHGIGIASEQQASIFDLFTQGISALDRSQGGLGIGLSLVRAIVEMHRGTVTVSSAGLGLGSVFTVILPLSAAPAAPVLAAAPPVWPALQPASLPTSSPTSSPTSLPTSPPTSTQSVPAPVARAPQGLHILLIDDNSDSNDTLSDLLQQEGHIISCAVNGQSGLKLAREHAFHVIVCDLGMPGMSGFDVVRQLRLQQRQPAPYLIALTGYNQSNHRARAMEAGFDQFLMKPMAFDVLLDLVSSSVRPSR